jgi:cytochrome b561
MSNVQVYDRVSSLLHWLLAVLILFLIFYHPSTEEGHSEASALATRIHTSTGMLILLLVIARIVWRIRYASVPPDPNGEPWQVLARKLVHVAFYPLMLLAPLMGILVSFASELDVSVLGLFAIPQLISSESTHDVLRSLHGLSADLLLYLSALHIAVALYHQFRLKDQLIQRMLS